MITTKKKISKLVKKTKKKKTKKIRGGISVSIIGHNEGEYLKELLPTLSWAQEVIYVDCESDDDSMKIARRYGCRVYQRKNNLNPNVNKQFGISRARGEWVLYLDPDERLTDSGVKELQLKASTDHGYQAFRIDRKNYMFDRFLFHGGVYPDTQLRFFKNGMAYFLQKHIHEFLQVNGKIGKLKTEILHYTYRDVNQMVKKVNFSSSFEAVYMLKKGVKTHVWNAVDYIFLKPLHMFFVRYLVKRGYKDGYPGLIFAFFSSFHFPIRFFKLWELKSKQADHKSSK